MIYLKNRIKRDLSYYLHAHENKFNQFLHYFAFLFAFLGWIFLFVNVWVTVGLAVLHYLFSWIGHFYFEGNKPASFRYPHIGFYVGFMWFFIRTYELISRREVLSKFNNLK
ncbi:Mpo1-like protein [Cohnella sp. GCM10027633]|uniref:Mpo1-like protein n=1 Tax=unclassified Cohnella TaxID=2636738 RepID=UPI00362E947F